MEAGLVVLSGAIICMLGHLIGFGGGFLMIPLLTLGFGVPAHQAVAGCLAAIFPSSLLASVANARRGLIDFRVVLCVLATALVSAVGGAHVSAWLPGADLKRLFGLFLTALGVLLAWRLRSPRSEPEADTGWWARLRSLPPVVTGAVEDQAYSLSLTGVAGLGVLGGFASGLLGVGGGFLYSPGLMHGFRVPPRVAAATCLAMVAVTSLVGAASHLQLGHVEPRLTTLLVTGFVLGAGLSSWLGRKLPDGRRRQLLAAATLTAGFLMLGVSR